MKQLAIRIYGIIIEIWNYILNDLIASKISPPKVRPISDSLDKIINENYSMSRFGDGEFGIVLGNSIMFQEKNPKLIEEMKEILECEEDGILICIPDIFEELDEYVPRAEHYWKQYLHKNRYSLYKLLTPPKKKVGERIFYNTQISRFYIDYTIKTKMKQKVRNLQSIWNGKRLLIIEGEKSRLGIGNDFFDNAAGIIRIIGPSLNAYNKIDEIEAAALQRNDYDMILIALGPTATVLAYRLWKAGKQALDVGHIDIEYEWYLQGAQEKVAIKDKFMAEVQGGDDIGDLHSEIYESQIVGKYV